MPGGPTGDEDHEIGPIAMVSNGNDPDVICFDICENLLNLVQVQQPFVGVALDEGRTKAAIKP